LSDAKSTTDFMLNDGYEGLSFEVIVHLPIVIVPLKET